MQEHTSDDWLAEDDGVAIVVLGRGARRDFRALRHRAETDGQQPQEHVQHDVNALFRWNLVSVEK